jgi:hypothetical protein
MTTNPYTSPHEISRPTSDPAREIRTVANVFRWLGWMGITIYLPVTSFTMGALVHQLMQGRNDEFVPIVVANGVGWCMLSLSLAYLRTAKALAAGNPLAARAARVLSWVMLGFPIFMIVGVICLKKTNNNFAAYCLDQRE